VAAARGADETLFRHALALRASKLGLAQVRL